MLEASPRPGLHAPGLSAANKPDRAQVGSKQNFLLIKCGPGLRAPPPPPPALPIRQVVYLAHGGLDTCQAVARHVRMCQR